VAIDETVVGMEELLLLSGKQEGRLFRPQFKL